MSQTIRISDDLISEAKVSAKAFHRSLAGQIEFWAKVGRIAEANPEMNYEMIAGLLISLEQAKSGEIEPFEFK